MGKINKRRISSDRVRKIRKKKNKIIIAVEGKNKTERIYFNNFDDGKKSYSISIAKGDDTDPIKLVLKLIDEIDKRDINLKNGDIAYCVFDTDMDINKNIQIKEAIKIANKNNINIITSSPCIELWFLLHYEFTTANMKNNDVICRLKKYYPKYEKNVNIFPDITSNIDLAIKRAKKLEKYQIDNNRNIESVEANPHTDIYKIIEELNKG